MQFQKTLLFCICVYAATVVGKILPAPKYKVHSPPSKLDVSKKGQPPCYVKDDKYNNTSGGDWEGGYGDLVDGVFGDSNISCSANEPSPWVGWRFEESESSKNLTICFEFDQLYVFHLFTFNCLRQDFNGKFSVNLFTAVDIYLLEADNGSIGHVHVDLKRRLFRDQFEATNVSVCTFPNFTKPSQFVNITFNVEKGTRIVLGEFQFEGEPATSKTCNTNPYARTLNSTYLFDIDRVGKLECWYKRDGNYTNCTVAVCIFHQTSGSFLCDAGGPTLQTAKSNSARVTLCSQNNGSFPCISFLSHNCGTNSTCQMAALSIPVPSAVTNQSVTSDVVISTLTSSTASLGVSTASSTVSLSVYMSLTIGSAASSVSPSRVSSVLSATSHVSTAVFSVTSSWRHSVVSATSHSLNSSMVGTLAQHSASDVPFQSSGVSSQHSSSLFTWKASSPISVSPSTPYFRPSSGSDDEQVPRIVGAIAGVLVIVITLPFILWVLRRRTRQATSTVHVLRYQKNDVTSDPPYATPSNVVPTYQIQSESVGSISRDVIVNGEQRRPSDGLHSQSGLEDGEEDVFSDAPVYADVGDSHILPDADHVSGSGVYEQCSVDSLSSLGLFIPAAQSLSRVACVCDSFVFSPSFSEGQKSELSKHIAVSRYSIGLRHYDELCPEHVYESIEMDALSSGVTLRQCPRRVANLAIYASVDEINRHSMMMERQSCVVYDEVELNPEFILQLGSTAEEACRWSELSSTGLLPFLSVYADPAPLLQENGPLEMPTEKFVHLRHIGHGQFGDVYEALAKSMIVEDVVDGQLNGLSVTDIHVALKYLQKDASKDMEETFNKEVKFMAALKHPNVVQLIGVCSMVSPRFMVIEYMENGDLHQYLQGYEINESLLREGQELIKYPVLLGMTADIASGMAYLASKFFIHRDLAARNCLVGQHHHVKISDFGMTRSVYEKNYYRLAGRAILPIRWMAPETFYGKFTIASDVWAFGVTCWEILTLARARPYEEMQDRDVIENAVAVEGKKLLDRPPCCDEATFKIMMDCWSVVPDQRPQFDDIQSTMRHLAASQ